MDAGSAWMIAYDRFKPAEEGLREALCTLGNGYFAARGASAESPASRIHYPGTYVAGLFNKLPTVIAGRTIYNEDMVNIPNWLPDKMRIGKHEWLVPSEEKILSYHQELDMKRGMLYRKVVIEDFKGRRTSLEHERIVSMADPHIAAIRYTMVPMNYDEWVVMRSAIDGSVQNTGVARYRQLNSKHLKFISSGKAGGDGIYLAVKTNHSGVEVVEAARTRIFKDGKEVRALTRFVESREKKSVGLEFGVHVNRGTPYVIEKIVSVYTSRDKGVSNTVAAAKKAVMGAGNFEEIARAHRHTWEHLWDKFDIEVADDVFSQKVLRLHIFHLLQTASMHNTDIDAGLPARGLTGEAYRGHIFWDELYVMPFYNLHMPEISKALLMYRYNRLPKAREAARNAGHRGAMFPWQSGSTGEEETQVMHLNPLSGTWGPDNSHIQRHVSFAIAYNVWTYWRATGDRDFLIRNGAEMLLSIARFGASLCKYSYKDKRYHTEGLMGPDEFHERMPGEQKAGFKDNAYTNLLIAWLLSKVPELLAELPGRSLHGLLNRLRIKKEELDRWDDISRKLCIVINKDGIISQFDGYFKLKELDWDAYRKKYGNIKRLDRILKAEGKSPNEYKVAKQADALMVFYLFSVKEVKRIFGRLGYEFDKHMMRKNYDYYIHRTSHGSTLSKVVHGYLAHVLGKEEESWSWFQEILRSDIYDTQGGTTPEGIHVGVMGGSINFVMRDFAGIDIRDDAVKINPCLPKKWRRLRFRFIFRGHWVHLVVVKGKIVLRISGTRGRRFPVPFDIGAKRYHFYCGEINEAAY
ncbi:MAG: glycosyl hydrolase family 65 protein [Candidatus Omnitrophota bacterium]